jgi:hypothetical protein
MSVENEGGDEFTELVVVRVASTSAEAQLVAGFLQARGIAAVAQGANLAVVHPVFDGPARGVPVVVPAEFAQEARRVLAEMEPLEDRSTEAGGG